MKRHHALRLNLFALLAVLASLPLAAPLQAQNTASVGSGYSLPDALEAIGRARVTTRILYVTAHPDDESSSVLTYLARGLGAHVTLLSLTRGEGGQNALGPEQSAQLGILRTEELLEATKVYGVALFFTRAPDFGYSKTAEETLRVWGETALDDLVRVIRTVRPHVVVNHWGGVHTGHGHHQAAGILTPQAVAAAADPKAFPQHLAEGLRTWRAALLLELARGDTARGWRVPFEQVSPIWGKSYSQIGREGFAHHRTQGVSAFLSSPFLRRPISLVRTDGSPLDPKVLAEPLTAIPLSGSPGLLLEQAGHLLEEAREDAMKLDWPSSAKALAETGKRIAAQQEKIARYAKEDPRAFADTLEQTMWELDRVRERVDAALAIAAGLRLEAQADRSELVAGEGFSARIELRQRSHLLEKAGTPSLVLPPGWIAAKAEAESADAGAGPAVSIQVSTPTDARPPHSANDWMLPWPRPLVEAKVGVAVDGYSFVTTAPVMARRATSTRVDILPLQRVEAVTLGLVPRRFVIIEGKPPAELELFARVHCYTAAATKVAVGVDVPEGWQGSSPQRLELAGAGDQLVRFRVTPPVKLPAGNYALRPYVRLGEQTLRNTVEPLPSLPTRLWSEPAVALVYAFDVVVPDGLRVGYVAAENDPIPEVLRQLGVRVELLDPVALALSDLTRFDAIAIGIRAYELRDDLAAANRRLLDYAAAGGTLVVQYQREYIWNRLKPAPYPASIGQPAVRITDENSPVRLLLANHPALNFPNKISALDFGGWVQERGLYFWSQFDSRYQPLLAMRDPGEDEVTGGLVYARYGKGVYIYTGLAFFRQLPEGVPGAYRLFVNLLSQSRVKP